MDPLASKQPSLADSSFRCGPKTLSTMTRASRNIWTLWWQLITPCRPCALLQQCTSSLSQCFFSGCLQVKFDGISFIACPERGIHSFVPWFLGLALNGPVGSMARATEGLRAEQTQVVVAFYIMMASFGASTIMSFWVVMSLKAAISRYRRV